MFRLLLPILIAVPLFPLAACGGAEPVDLLSSAGGDASSVLTSADGSVIGSGDGGNVPTDSSTADASRDGGPPPSDGGGHDSGHDAGPTGDPGVHCAQNLHANTYCSLPGDVCCIEGNGTAGSPTYTCESSSCSSGTAVQVECDDRADCNPGDVCCGELDQGVGYTILGCASSCSGSSGQTTFVQFCDPNVPGECLGGLTCSASQGLPGYYRCKQ